MRLSSHLVRAPCATLPKVRRAIAGGLGDLLVRLKRIFQDREQDSVVPTLVTGIGTLCHCSTSLLVTLYRQLLPTRIASSMLQIVFKGWLASVLMMRLYPLSRWLIVSPSFPAFQSVTSAGARRGSAASGSDVCAGARSAMLHVSLHRFHSFTLCLVRSGGMELGIEK